MSDNNEIEFFEPEVYPLYAHIKLFKGKSKISQNYHNRNDLRFELYNGGCFNIYGLWARGVGNLKIDSFDFFNRGVPDEQE